MDIDDLLALYPLDDGELVYWFHGYDSNIADEISGKSELLAFMTEREALNYAEKSDCVFRHIIVSEKQGERFEDIVEYAIYREGAL